MTMSVMALQLAYHISTKSMGRRRLADRTGLTEMVVRVELENMRDKGIVQFNRSGVELTAKGQRYFALPLERIRLVDDISLTTLRLDTSEVAAHLSGSVEPPAWLLRDEAIREGATGMMLLVYREPGWAFSHDLQAVRALNPTDADEIEIRFSDAQPEDLLLIVSASTRGRASSGLWRGIQMIEQQ